MALLISRASPLLRSQGGQKLCGLLKQSSENCLGPCTTLAANLTAYPDGVAPRYQPWPYEKKGFKMWHMAMDRADWRLDDNSKVIVIDGNVGTGKTELGKYLAKQFDLLYVPDVTDSDMYQWETGWQYDSREHDERLPFESRTCDFAAFYQQKGFKKVLNNFPRTQYFLFRYKMLKYAQLVTAHVLNTGQGVVMNRGMWSDLVWAHSLRKTGWMSPQALKHYKTQYKFATDYWWHPHLVIYLDAPLDLIKENVKKRNVAWEQNSPVLTDDFYQAMSDAYQEHYLPHMRQHGEVLTYDLGEGELDYELVVEHMEDLNLDDPTDEYPERFEEWSVHNREYNRVRRMISPHNQRLMEEIFGFHPPYGELWLDGADYYEFEDILRNDPRAQDQEYAKMSPAMAALKLGSSINPAPCSLPLRKSR